MEDDGLGDWRIRAVSRLAKGFTSPEGHVYKAGSPVTLVTITEIGKGQVLSFTTPSPPALALSIAIRAARRANELRKRLVFTEKVESYPLFHKKPEVERLITNDRALYDFFEECMIAVAFSFQALETFSNTLIAEEVKRTYLLKRRKEELELSADELQRKASTEEKLGTVLPEILSMESPKGKEVWQSFKQLKRIRDMTTHMKAHDAHSGVNVHRETIFYKFLHDKIEEFPVTAINIIAYFFKDGQLPRWLMLAREKITKV